MTYANEVKAELDLGPPCQELLDWAKKELNEDPETRCQVLSEFRDMIYERGECMPHRTDDAFLLRFLRARKFIIQKAHRLFVNYHEFKENNPQFFEDVDLIHLKHMGEADVITVPPYREQTGRRILLYRIGNWDPEAFTVDELIQATLVILELAILEEQAQILGGIAIFDLGGLTMQQAWQMSPSLATKVIQIMVTCFPMKIEAIHIVNQSWMFDMVYNIFKPLLSDIMKERIHFHGEDMESLHRYMNPKYLPEKYGGVHPDYNYNDWMNYFSKTERIKTEMKSLGYKIDELDKEFLGEKENKEEQK